MTYNCHLTEGVNRTLPGLERYALALTRSPERARAMVQAAVEGFHFIKDGPRLHIQLFRDLQVHWNQTTESLETCIEAEIFLLQQLEGFSVHELSSISGLSGQSVFRFLAHAHHLDDESSPAQVMILEGAHTSGQELCAAIEVAGYPICAIARTRPDAERLVTQKRPEIILTAGVLSDGNLGLHIALECAALAQNCSVILVRQAALDATPPLPVIHICSDELNSSLEHGLRKARSLSRYFRSCNSPLWRCAIS